MDSECAICLETFLAPSVLPCTHTFCYMCLEDLQASCGQRPLNCPLCRQKFKFYEIRTYRLINLLGDKMVLQCTRCRDTFTPKGHSAHIKKMSVRWKSLFLCETGTALPTMNTSFLARGRECLVRIPPIINNPLFSDGPPPSFFFFCFLSFSFFFM